MRYSTESSEDSSGKVVISKWSVQFRKMLRSNGVFAAMANLPRFVTMVFFFKRSNSAPITGATDWENRSDAFFISENKSINLAISLSKPSSAFLLSDVSSLSQTAKIAIEPFYVMHMRISCRDGNKQHSGRLTCQSALKVMRIGAFAGSFAYM